MVLWINEFTFVTMIGTGERRTQKKNLDNIYQIFKNLYLGLYDQRN